jgi:hypothetical protein
LDVIEDAFGINAFDIDRAARQPPGHEGVIGIRALADCYLCDIRGVAQN